MISLGAGDDFANIGYDVGNGPTWQATGATPTTWLSSEITVAAIAERNAAMNLAQTPTGFEGLLYPFMARYWSRFCKCIIGKRFGRV